MTDDLVAEYAEAMSEIERKVVSHCWPGKTLGYQRIADAIDASYSEVRAVGRFLQSAGLAEIRLLKPGFNGSGIFLSDDGMRVKQALAELSTGSN